MSRIGKSLVEQFTTSYPDETDEQILARLQRAARSAGNPDAELPLTLEDVARWRTEVAR